MTVGRCILKEKTVWLKKPAQVGDKISFSFSWDLWKWLQEPREDVIIGGPAVVLNPEWIPSSVRVGEFLEDALSLHCGIATRTTKGCPRNCDFCGVRKLHPKFEELQDWEIKPVLIDDNLLAATRKHFDRVIDRLKILDWCDFNQGLDPRFLRKHHAERFAELRNPILRLTLDSSDYEGAFINAYELLRKAGLLKRHIKVYVLIGFEDTPEDALSRLELVWKELKLSPNPTRYQPLDAKKRNEFVGEGWDRKELARYIRYWSRLKYTGAIPFDEFINK